MGDKKMDKGTYIEAVHFYELALKIYPNNTEAKVKLWRAGHGTDNN